MEQRGWTRGLDDRADRLLKRRFGVGLRGDPVPSLRKQVGIALAGAGTVVVIVVVALVASGHRVHLEVVLWPILSVIGGTLLGRVLRDSRKRR
jgi:hypothetical protein